MRIISTLPLALLSFGLVHAHAHSGPFQPAHQHPRRLNTVPSSEKIVERQHTSGGGGILGGLVDNDEGSTSVGSTTLISSTRSTVVAPISTVVPSSSVIPETTTEEEDTTVLPSTRVTSSALVPSITSISSTSSSVLRSSDTLSSSAIVASASSSSTSSIVANVTTTATSEAPSSSSQSVSADPSSASVQTTVNEEGQTQLVTVILTQAAAATDAAATASSSTDKKKDDGDSFPIAAIIGISVGAGVVVLLLIGFAVWRMKRRTGDEDEAIRWPELNRHGDSDAHHALPARQTGQHGFETNPLSRSLSNSSSIFAPSNAAGGAAPHSAGPAPMALNGSSFGASSSLEDEYSEKHAAASHDDHENYTSLPPPLQMHSGFGQVESDYPPSIGGRSQVHLHEHDQYGLGAGLGGVDDEDPYGGMTMANESRVTLPNPHSPTHIQTTSHSQTNYRIE